MGKVILVIVAAGLILMGVGLLVLGAFPPHPAPAPVTHVIPNDKFQGQ